MADSVAKVLPTGIQTIQSLEAEHKQLRSYKLIVQVEGGRPSDNLLRYMQMDGVGVTLEYQTDQQSYYILSNMTMSLLFKKSNFMEINQELLGLINFEFVSVNDYEDQPKVAIEKTKVNDISLD